MQGAGSKSDTACRELRIYCVGEPQHSFILLKQSYKYPKQPVMDSYPEAAVSDRGRTKVKSCEADESIQAILKEVPSVILAHNLFMNGVDN